MNIISGFIDHFFSVTREVNHFGFIAPDLELVGFLEWFP